MDDVVEIFGHKGEFFRVLQLVFGKSAGPRRRPFSGSRTR